jgi:hypothetical protein
VEGHDKRIVVSRRPVLCHCRLRCTYHVWFHIWLKPQYSSGEYVSHQKSFKRQYISRYVLEDSEEIAFDSNHVLAMRLAFNLYLLSLCFAPSLVLV